MIRFFTEYGFFYPRQEYIRFPELAFPDGDDFPAEHAEFTGVFFIVGDVAFEFFLPEGFVSSRHMSGAAFFVLMPEAAVDKNHRPVFRQNDVRLAGQGADVFAEAVSGAVQHGADKHFRFRVFAPDSRHIPASLFWRQAIHAQSVTLGRRKSKTVGRFPSGVSNAWKIRPERGGAARRAGGNSRRAP